MGLQVMGLKWDKNCFEGAIYRLLRMTLGRRICLCESQQAI